VQKKNIEKNPTTACAVDIEIGVGFISATLMNFMAHPLWDKRAEVKATTTPKECLDFGTALVEMGPRNVGGDCAVARGKKPSPAGGFCGLRAWVSIRVKKMCFRANQPVFLGKAL